MTAAVPVEFLRADLLQALQSITSAEFDALPFGVIGFDQEGVVRRYNAREAAYSGLESARVLGHDLFTVVAQCFNNFLVAQRFDDAAESGSVLDDTLDYVLTWRMRPAKVRVRLLAAPGVATRYLAIARL